MEEIFTEHSDIVTTVVQIINELFTNLLASIDKNIFPLLDELVFIDRNTLISGDKMNQIISTSPSSGVLLLANSLFTAFVLYYAVRLMISHVTGNSIESPPRFFLRAFLAGVFMNFSLPICTALIDTTNAITNFFCELGKSVLGMGDVSFVTLNQLLNHSVTSSLDAFSLEGILSRNVIFFFFCLNYQFFIPLHYHESSHHPFSLCYPLLIHQFQFRYFSKLVKKYHQLVISSNYHLYYYVDTICSNERRK